MPLERDEHEERLARIDQILENLKAEVRRATSECEQTILASRLTRERAEAARQALKRERLRAMKTLEQISKPKR